jgi:hypothetical protein
LGNASSRAPKGIPSLLEHATVIEQQLERHGPDESTVRLSFNDDVFVRASTWARWQLDPLAGGLTTNRRM